jgi:hypothetical protein
MRPKHGGRETWRARAGGLLALGELGRLGEVAVRAAEVAVADLAGFGADRAPRLAGAVLGDADDRECEEADQDVRADPLGAA